jgi:probable HAF family extracellular repeat protein
VGFSDMPDQTFHAFLWTARDGVMHDLGTLGGTISIANAISDDGVVVGASATAPDDFQHAFMWTRHAGMVDLGTLGGIDSVAQGVSDTGVVVGSSHAANGDNHAFVWTKHTGMVDIGTAGPNSGENQRPSLSARPSRSPARNTA